MNGFTNDLRSEVASGALHLQHFRMRAIAKYLRGRVVGGVGCGGVVPAILHGPDRIAGDAGRKGALSTATEDGI